MTWDQIVLYHGKIVNLLWNYHMSMYRISLYNFGYHTESVYEIKMVIQKKIEKRSITEYQFDMSI
jgi:hypothetical protein